MIGLAFAEEKSFNYGEGTQCLKGKRCDLAY